MKAETRSILGVPVADLAAGDIVRAFSGFLDEGGRRTALYANVHVVNQAQRDARLREILNRADLVYCDGAGVQLGARLLGEHLAPRSTGADLVWDVAAMCARGGHALYWAGGAPGVARAACDALVARFPGLRVAGARDGFFAKEGAAAREVIDAINRAAPALLIVGMGTPIQERWVDAHRHELAAPLVWCVGAAADYLAGVVPRAPRWMRALPLEWLYRLALEPRRMFGRYVVGNPLFLGRILAARMRRRRAGA